MFAAAKTDGRTDFSLINQNVIEIIKNSRFVRGRVYVYMECHYNVFSATIAYTYVAVH